VQGIHDNDQHSGRTHGVTGADGSFQLRTRGEEPVNVVVGSGKTGFAFQAAIAPGIENLTLRLRPGGTMRVRAHGQHGDPKSGLSVQGPVGIDGARYLELYGARTGSDGCADLPVPAGLIDIVVRGAGGRTLAKVRENVVEGQTSEADVLVEDAGP
jgi:hypothetical protein